MSLLDRFKKVSGGVTTAPKLLVYGPEGIGKTSLAAAAPGVFVVSAEDGLARLSGVGYASPASWDAPSDNPETPSLFQLVEAIGTDDDVKVVAFDTIDWIVAQLLEPHLCRQDGVTRVEDAAGGYGKWVKAAEGEVRRFLSALDRLRAKGKTILLLAHSRSFTFKNPEGQDYDRYTLAINEKLAAVLKQWPDFVGFYNYDTHVETTKADASKLTAKGKGYGTERVIHTERKPAFDAKQRHGMPPRIDIGKPEDGWRALAGYLFSAPSEAGSKVASKIDDLRTEIVAGLAKLNDAEKTAKTEAWLQTAGGRDVSLLVQTRDKINALIIPKEVAA